MVKRIASALCALERVPLGAGPDPLRLRLVEATHLPFAPGSYRVWRNYKRVFGCCMLAADVDGQMICSALCHKIASPGPGNAAADDYFGHFARHFYHPSPVFKGYTSQGVRAFPVAAVLKLLLARARNAQPARVSAGEVAAILVANNRTGLEPVAEYAGLLPRRHAAAPDELRQIREFMRFISQMSILKWAEPNLFLDVDTQDAVSLQLVESLAQPILRERNPNAALELLALGVGDGAPLVMPAPAPLVEGDVSFTEGMPKRVSHLRYERSRKLREIYFDGRRQPFTCDMCALNPRHRYPWAENLLELHHLLPLASPLRVESRRASVSDLVAICPNCLKATHIFYGQWLDRNQKDDFATPEEAREAYGNAKRATAPGNLS